MELLVAAPFSAANLRIISKATKLIFLVKGDFIHNFIKKANFLEKSSPKNKTKPFQKDLVL